MVIDAMLSLAVQCYPDEESLWKRDRHNEYQLDGRMNQIQIDFQMNSACNAAEYILRSPILPASSARYIRHTSTQCDNMSHLFQGLS